MGLFRSETVWLTLKGWRHCCDIVTLTGVFVFLDNRCVSMLSAKLSLLSVLLNSEVLGVATGAMAQGLLGTTEVDFKGWVLFCR